MSLKYLIKGDISGIQNFIFNVQSKSAAKTLKAKSFFIEAIGWLAERKIKEVFKNARCNYNGGGNFYIEVDQNEWNAKEFTSLQEEFKTTFAHETITLCLTFMECATDKTYSDWLIQINKLSGKNKLSLFNNLSYSTPFFLPYTDKTKMIRM